jgi:hypothetical protein
MPDRLYGNCASCGTLGGPTYKNGTVRRFSGVPFNIQGVLCLVCFQREKRRIKQKEGFLGDFDIKTTITEIPDYFIKKDNPNLLKILQQSEQKDRIVFEILKNRYKVDVVTGKVTTLYGIEVTPFTKGGPIKYLQLRLQYNGKRIMVRLHRVIAMTNWGVDAIIGKEINHKDHNPANNCIDNLEIMQSRKEHQEKDSGGPLNNIGMVKRKLEWAPCAKCGNENGSITKSHKSPRRFDGKPYGIEGEICSTCYVNIRHRLRDGLPALAVKEALKPCAKCGTEVGYIPKGCSKPSRLNGTKFGIEGKICVSCFNKLNDKRRVNPIE